MLESASLELKEQLQAFAKGAQTTPITQRFASDPERSQRMQLEVGDLFLDYAKNTLDQDSLKCLVEFARQSKVEQAVKHMMQGASINVTEKRPAWHSLLRMDDADPRKDQSGFAQTLSTTWQQFEQWVERLQSGYVGGANQTITDVVHIGIGGSDLGPRFLVDALKASHVSSIRVHFVANIDPEELEEVLSACNPCTTLFILASKSFRTQETLVNGHSAKQWLQTQVNDWSKHFIALTANPDAALEWGVAPSHILPLWDWVGGRFSVWSSIGLPLALKIGTKGFHQFLQGGATMDRHFEQSPLEQNMPVLLALIGFWHHSLLGYNSQVILPYSYRLKQFPDYLQQLEMESNGKQAMVSGGFSDVATCPVIWGQAGTNGQHAFYQLLHQGSHTVPADFILVSKPNSSNNHQHQLLLSHGLAQAKVMAQGFESEDSFQWMQGNKPSNTLVLKQLSAHSLGMLIALYEHKVFVQGLLWQINSFDQPGVELGKRLANEIYPQLSEGAPSACSLTQSLIDKLRES